MNTYGSVRGSDETGYEARTRVVIVRHDVVKGGLADVARQGLMQEAVNVVHLQAQHRHQRRSQWGLEITRLWCATRPRLHAHCDRTTCTEACASDSRAYVVTGAQFADVVPASDYIS